MQYTYEFEMWRGEAGWCIAPFGLNGATQGEDVADACESAADWLRETVRDYVMRGQALPPASFGNAPKRGGVTVVVSVDAAMSEIPRMSAAEAAHALGVTRPRVTAMLASGLLDGWRDGRNTWVTKASVRARLADERKAGRPRAAAAK
ncbi:helix-turn-helix domain-containing protein [Adlercreutzia sp. ZJ242]|uniref:helix-turn-helix domain-containing protein n=1 Tax=Adlercreutzia sp. ZJ242 TaxID=2709409 RepID=UPI0013EA648C|nr:helix-turn-helix domain-containing protein [Adlercreutzia sp. ZJ242]